MLLRVHVTHESLSPLLMNPMTEEILDGLRTRTSATKDRTKSVHDEAAEKVIRDEHGRIGIPVTMYFSCLAEAGRSVKGPDAKQISTAISTTLPSFLTIEDQFFPFPDGTDWVPDKRRGVGKQANTPTAVCIVRPKVIDWGFTASLVIDLLAINPETVIQLIRVAGRKIGLGDFRPACRGQFGMFKITRWQEVEEWDERDDVEIIRLPSRQKSQSAVENADTVTSALAKRRSSREARERV